MFPRLRRRGRGGRRRRGDCSKSKYIRMYIRRSGDGHMTWQGFIQAGSVGKLRICTVFVYQLFV